MELKKEVESLLFSSGKEMSEEELAELTNSPKNSVKKALQALNKDYEERDSSLLLVNKGSSWKINVQEKYINLVTKIVADTELGFPVLETLAVIAYNAPAIQADIIKVRGTNAYEHIGLLVNEEFVEKRKEGRSFRLSLTPKFFKYFDVKSNKDIKEALKQVKQPQKKNAEEKKASDKVGSLDVVDVLSEEKPGIRDKADKDVDEEDSQVERLGDLEVVDEPEEKEDTEQPLGEEDSKETGNEDQDKQEEKKIFERQKKKDDTNHIDQDFLEDIDKQIDELSKKNDELDKDESFKRREYEEDQENTDEDKGIDEEEPDIEKEDEDYAGEPAATGEKPVSEDASAAEQETEEDSEEEKPKESES